MSTPEPPSGAGGPELSRDLGTYAVFATAAGTMIGAGIFVLPGVAAAAAGPAASLSFLLAGAIAFITALAVCELATAMPRAGGGYYFVSRAMGPLPGSVVGWGAWVALMFKGSFALVGLAEYARIFVDAPVTALALAAGVALLAVNLVGAKASTVLQNLIVVLLLALMGLFLVWGSFAVDLRTMRPLLPEGWSGMLAATGLVFIAYLGIEKAAAISEEVRDPGRAIPRGILAAVASVTLLYVGTMLVVTGVVPMPDLVESRAPVAAAAGVFMGGAGMILMAVAGLLATASTGNAAILSSSRYPFAMARDRLLAPWLSDVSRRFGTPIRALLVTGGIMLALVVALDVEQLAKMGSAFNILVFASVNGAVILLRRSAPGWYDPAFRMPLVPGLPALGAVAALALLPTMGAAPALVAGTFILGGAAWYFWYRDRGEGRPYPRYHFGDQVARIREVEALERKRVGLVYAAERVAGSSVVVELVEGKPTRLLLTVARALAVRRHATVDAVVVTEVPAPTPLAAGGRAVDAAWRRKVMERLAADGLEVRFHHVLARNRDRAVLHLLGEETQAVLLDWHRPLRIHRLRDSHVDVILRKSPARVAVLKTRSFRGLDRIDVAAAGGPYERTEVEIADALAVGTGASIRFLRVVPPRATEERVRNTEAYLQELTDLVTGPADARVLVDDDVVEALAEASANADLLLVGASREPRFRRAVFGRLADRLARRARVSVLVTRDPEARLSLAGALLGRRDTGG